MAFCQGSMTAPGRSVFRCVLAIVPATLGNPLPFSAPFKTCANLEGWSQSELGSGHEEIGSMRLISLLCALLQHSEVVDSLAQT